MPSTTRIGVADPVAGRRSTLRLVVAVASIAAAAHVAGAQESRDATRRDSSRAWIVRVATMAGAKACPCNSMALEVPRNRRLHLVAVGARWPLVVGRGGLELAYELQALPLILSRGTADGDLHVSVCPNGRYCAISDSYYPWTTTAVGAGILPLGLTGLVPLAPRLRLRLRASGGILRLSNPVPVVEGRKFNFMADGSAALELRVSSTLSLNAGVVQNHISNGGTARINPGMDSRMLEVGLVRRRR